MDGVANAQSGAPGHNPLYASVLHRHGTRRRAVAVGDALPRCALRTDTHHDFRSSLREGRAEQNDIGIVRLDSYIPQTGLLGR